MKKEKTARFPRPDRRRLRFGGFSLLLTVIVIAAVILANVAFGRLEQHFAWAVDVNALRATEFDPATYEVLRLMDRDAYIYTVSQSGSGSALGVQVSSILEKYASLNPHIRLDHIDPVTEPMRVRALCGDTEVQDGAVIVASADGSRVKIFNRDDYFGTASYGSYHFTYLYLERYVTGALVYVTSSETPHVFFLSGHGEIPLDGCSMLSQALETRNYEPATLDLSKDPDALGASDALVIADPARDLSDDEYTLLRAWLAGGGRLLVSLGYQVDTSALPNLCRLLDYFQLAFGEGVVYENSNQAERYWNGSTLNLVPVLNAEHEITSRLISLGSGNLIIPQARPIAPVLLPESGSVFTPLLTTSSQAVAVREEEAGTPGEQILAMAMLRADPEGRAEKDVRIVLMDSAYLLADSSLLRYCYNLNFAVTSVDWLINSESTVDVSSKVMTNSTLSIPDSGTAVRMGIWAIGAVPLAVLAAGLAVHFRRRRL